MKAKRKHSVSVHAAGCSRCIVISRAPPPTSPPAHPPPSLLSQGKVLTLAWLGDGGCKWGGGGKEEVKTGADLKLKFKAASASLRGAVVHFHEGRHKRSHSDVKQTEMR